MIETLTIEALASKVASGAVSASEVARDVIARIERYNGGLNALVSADPARILAQAAAIDAKRARGEALGPLAGVPIAIKDAICTEGESTTAGSKILSGYAPPYDATVITKLRNANAILVGKANMDEFAMGSSTENSAYGPARNPWDPARTPGGSSGGSAVAVSARLALGALGSDTGGSIRQPASLTGTVGVKPTYGRVSRYGLIAFASSLEQIGPFATDVRGSARLMEVIAGHDRHDATSLNTPVGSYESACGASLKGLRVGIPEEYFAAGLSPDVESAVRAALSKLESDGCVVEPVKLPHTRFAVATYYVIATAEASSNLARFDGVRYGLRVASKSLRDMYGATRDAGFGKEVKRRILLGTFVLSAGYYDAYYLRAQKVRTLIRRDFEEAFARVDVIASPTAPTTAFKLGEKVDDPLAMYLSDIYTLPASLAGVPALSVPCGLGADGLPIGLQLVAPALQESRLFTFASAVETHFAPSMPSGVQ
jgi:aspartyl-tRNA(Asn)/glutamyl-tRNA(Gln) amidotransferase subunit A